MKIQGFSMLKNLKISSKIALAFGVLIVVMLAGSAVSLLNTNKISAVVHDREEATTFLATVETAVASVSKQQANVLNLLVTGDRTSIDRFNALETEFDGAIKSALETAPNDGIHDLLTRYTQKLEAWHDGIVVRQFDLMGNALTVNEARAIEVSGEPQRLLAEAGAIATELGTQVNQLVGDLTAAEAAAITTVEIASWVVNALMLVFAIGAALMLTRMIAVPIRSMSGAMLKLADGNVEIDIPGVGQSDEIGEMAGAVQVFKDNKIEADRLSVEREKAQEAQAARAKRIEDLCKAFDATSSEAVRAVASAASEMQSSSEAMNATAEETTRQSAAVASASEEASSNVQTVATAAEELSASITEISRQVSQASTIASGAVQQAEQTNIKVQGLADAANKIGEVVALITDIADQTNLLALNATIEAARAGDAGKGFAVVASEVKNLANQTAKATEEIGSQIGGIQTATQEAVAAIAEIGKTISEIDEVASGIASAVEEQGAATQEIARNVEQAAAGTQEVSSNIGGVSQAANDTGAAATQIQSAAGELSLQSETLRTEVDRFLAEVRSA